MVYGLSTLWSGAVGGTAVYFHARMLTLLLGGLGGLVAALFAIWLTLRRQVTSPAPAFDGGQFGEGIPGGSSRSRGRWGIVAAVVAFVGVAIVLFVTPARGGEAVAGAFFGAGALLLIGTLGLSQAALRLVAGGWNRPLVSLQGLGLRNATRRSGRSLAIIGLLACGVFMVVAVGANRHDPAKEAQGRDSGTGGFALYGDIVDPDPARSEHRIRAQAAWTGGPGTG